MQTNNNKLIAWLRQPAVLYNLALVVMLAAGFALRMVDLKDPPMDFHPVRQYRGALKARSIYYNLSPDIDPETQALAEYLATGFEEYEPPIVENMVAYSYLLMGGENLWVSRIITSLFWILGGAALYALVARLTSKTTGLLVTAYYLFLPFSVAASRSFQPDPFMTMWIIFAIYAMFRWSDQPNWKTAIIAGLMCGIAVFVKAMAAPFIGGLAVAAVLSVQDLRKTLRDPQVYAMAALMVLPSLWYYFGVVGDNSSEYVVNWILVPLVEVLHLSFYIRWLHRLTSLIGLAPFLAAMVGMLLARDWQTRERPQYRRILVGLWLGYLVYAYLLPLQTQSHSYYFIQLVPVVALSMAPLVEMVVEGLGQQGRGWKVAFTALVLLGIAYPSWITRSDMLADSNTAAPAFYEGIAAQLPEGEFIGFSKDYGLTLRYYGWTRVARWPGTADRALSEMRGTGNEGENFEDFFLNKIDGKDFFLVTALGNWRFQTDLQDYLYSHYPLYDQGDYYIIFDLRQTD